MKKTKLSVLAALLTYSAILTSCYTVLPEEHDLQQQVSGSSKLSLKLKRNVSTRSSISPDESLIRDICVMAYRKTDGRLAAIQTGTSADEIGLELTNGSYNVYVTANMGRFNAPVNESEIGNAFHSINIFYDMRQALPMCWKGEADIKAGDDNTVYASLSRLVSKIEFRVETGVLEGLEITSARLCQGAGRVRPFMEGGSRILAQNESVNGDYATLADITRLNAGQSICFYATENCQGMLLPDNSDPWTKVPDSIGDKADLCTYVEVKGRWNETADYEGIVTYRFYLGEDATRSFDVRRNSTHELTLYLEEESFDKISWKIDASQMEPAVWEVYPDFTDNYHKDGDFYVTENICLDFSFDDRGQRYWNKRNNAFTLLGVGNDGDTVIRFGQPEDIGNGHFKSMGTCIGKGRYDIHLINSETGEIEYIMTGGTIYAPVIVAGREGMFTDSPVEEFDKASEFMINGNSSDICLYLTDKDGYNLNQGEYYGCDFSICNWTADIVNDSHGYSLYDKVSVETLQGISGSDSYAVRYRLNFSNDGKDGSWNRRLSESLGHGSIAIRYNELCSGSVGEHRMGLFCDEIEITFKPVPDDKKSLMGTEFMYGVNNPSNLPLSIMGLKLNGMKEQPSQPDIRPVVCDAISGHTRKDPMLISRMPSTYCSLEDGAATSTFINGKIYYAADDYGISQDMIPRQLSMFHTFEAALAYEPALWTPKISGRIDLYGSSAESNRYGHYGFMNCGLIMYSYDRRHELFDSNNGTRTDFREYGDLLNKEYVRKFNEIIELDININDRNEITATASREVELDIAVLGYLKGHIRCVTVQDPFYTVWGKYYTHLERFYHSATVRLGNEPTIIDNGGLAESFELMRSQPYYSVVDVWDEEEFRQPSKMKGTIREYLKPNGLELAISIMSPDGTPVAVSVSGKAKYDYKTSSPVNWDTGLFSSVTIVPSSYSGFDSKLDDDGCPAGSLFKEEPVELEPDVRYGYTHNLYYMTR